MNSLLASLLEAKFQSPYFSVVCLMHLQHRIVLACVLLSRNPSTMAFPLEGSVHLHVPPVSQLVPATDRGSESKSPVSFLSSTIEPASHNYHDDFTLPFEDETLEDFMELVKDLSEYDQHHENNRQFTETSMPGFLEVSKEIPSVGPSQLAQNLAELFEKQNKDSQEKNLLPSDPEFTNFLQDQRTKIQESATNGISAQQTLHVCLKRVDMVQKALLLLTNNKALSQSQSYTIWQIGMRAITKFVIRRSSYETATKTLPSDEEIETQLAFARIFIQALFEFWTWSKGEAFGSPEERCQWFAQAFLREVKPPYHEYWEAARFRKALDDATRERLTRELFQYWKFDKFFSRKANEFSATERKVDIQRWIPLNDYFHSNILPTTIPIEFPLEDEMIKMIQNPGNSLEQIRLRIEAWAKILPSISKSQDTWPRKLGENFFGLLNEVFNREISYVWNSFAGDALVLAKPEVEKTLERMVQLCQVLWSHAYAQKPEVAKQLTRLMEILPGTFPFDQISLQKYKTKSSEGEPLYLKKELHELLGDIYSHVAVTEKESDIANIVNKLLYLVLPRMTDLFTTSGLDAKDIGSFSRDLLSSKEDHLSSGVQVLPVADQRPNLLVQRKRKKSS